jgi:integrase/recombinase XerD
MARLFPGDGGFLVVSPSREFDGITGQADSDEHLVMMWLHGRSHNTKEYYARTAKRFLTFTQKPLQQVVLSDIQMFADSLKDMASGSQVALLRAIRSLFSFAVKIDYVPFNVAAPLVLPKAKNTIAERILSEEQVQAMIAKEPNTRNRLILKLFYATGIRVSELCALKWRDVQEIHRRGQITVFGKGGVTRTIVLPTSIWKELKKTRAKAPLDAPVFPSRKRGGHLTRDMVGMIVRDAGKRAGIKVKVSPHWLRHAHASHSLDNGAPIHLVQKTLGHASLSTTTKYVHCQPNESSGNYLNF